MFRCSLRMDRSAGGLSDQISSRQPVKVNYGPLIYGVYVSDRCSKAKLFAQSFGLIITFLDIDMYGSEQRKRVFRHSVLLICCRGARAVGYIPFRMALTRALPPGFAATRIRHCQDVGIGKKFIGDLLADHEGQDIAEYAVLLATILLLVVGTARLIGPTSKTVFSTVASFLQSAPSDSD
jgi:Flp pilus assembly pilin Flp